jgi:hypothetical protein
MNKKFITIVAAVLTLIALGWYTFKLVGDDGTSDSQYIEFAVEDTTTIDKIIITDPFSQRMELLKKDKEWTDGKGGCISQTNVHFILEAFSKITFKGYLPEKAQKKFTELMATSHTKVQIFQDGEWIKTWYIGPAAQDHLGQIMLLETADDGKSAYPVMMSIKGMYGIIEPRFFADNRKWICTNIFSLELQKIARVDVKFPKEPYRSFSISQKNMNFTIKQNGQKLSEVDTSNVFRYLQGYRKIHFELANYELNKKQCDSLKKTTPFCVLSLKETSGKSTQLRMFRISSKVPQRNEFGESVDMDMNKFWCELPNGDLVKCQYFTFNPLILGHVFFPAMEKQFPISELNKEVITEDPLKKKIE